MTDNIKYYKSKKYSFAKDSENDKFFLNDNPLVTDANGSKEDIDMEEFKKKIAQKVVSFVNRSFDNIIILFGAGASVIKDEVDENIDKKLKSGVTVAKIADRIYRKLDEVGDDIVANNTSSDLEHVDLFQKNTMKNPYTLIGAMKEINYPIPEKFHSKSEEGDSVSNKGFDLENFLSRLLAYKEFVPERKKEKYEKTVDTIESVIIDCTFYDYSDAPFKHEQFLKAISNYLHKNSKLQLVTTNYDTLLEDVADKMQWTVFDGFTFSQHPQFDSDLFNWNLVKRVPNVRSNENIYKENVANLFKLHGSVTWEEDGNRIIRKNKKNLKNPLMVFPSSDKYAQSYQEPYFELFTKFQELLKKPNTLLITAGFSFADDHIFRMISSSIRTNNSLSTLVTDYNISDKLKDSNWNKLEELMDSYYDVAFLKGAMNGDLADYFGANTDEN